MDDNDKVASSPPNPPPSHSLTIIDDLPNELLFNILDRTCKFENMLQVCKRWHAIVDDWIGRTVANCSTPMLIHPSSPDVRKAGLELISEIGVRYFEVEAGNRNGTLLEAPSSTLPSFKNPYLLRYLTIYSSVHPELFNNLVKGTVNLRGLGISLTVLSKLRNSDLKQLCPKFPRLTTLCVESPAAAANDDDPTGVPFLPNLETLLKTNRFPNLTRLSFRFPVSTYLDLEAVEIILPFIQAHPFLNDLHVGMIFPNEWDPVDRNLFLEKMRQILAEVNKHDCCSSLAILELHGRTANRQNLFGAYPQLEIWKEFALQQRSLKELSLEMGFISSEDVKTICTRNGASLRKLNIDQLDKDFEEGEAELRFDLGSLSPLQCLPKLDLHVRHRIIGTRQLPPCLVEVDMTGTMSSDELHNLLLNVPALRKITYSSYYHYHIQEEYSVRLETLQEFAQIRRVERLYIDCVGEDFPQDGIPNGDPEKPRMLTCYKRNCLMWDLTRSGYYFNPVKRSGNAFVVGRE